MLNEDDLKHYITLLEGDEGDRRIILGILSTEAVGDMRLLPYIERLLDDRTITVLGVPLNYGEIRFVAAEALARQRAGLKIDEVVSISGTFYPIRAGDALQRASKAGISTSGEGTVEVVKKLVSSGLVQLV